MWISLPSIKPLTTSFQSRHFMQDKLATLPLLQWHLCPRPPGLDMPMRRYLQLFNAVELCQAALQSPIFADRGIKPDDLNLALLCRSHIVYKNASYLFLIPKLKPYLILTAACAKSLIVLRLNRTRSIGGKKDIGVLEHKKKRNEECIPF